MNLSLSGYAPKVRGEWDKSSKWKTKFQKSEKNVAEAIEVCYNTSNLSHRFSTQLRPPWIRLRAPTGSLALRANR